MCRDHIFRFLDFILIIHPKSIAKCTCNLLNVYAKFILYLCLRPHMDPWKLLEDFRPLTIQSWVGRRIAIDRLLLERKIHWIRDNWTYICYRLRNGQSFDAINWMDCTYDTQCGESNLNRKIPDKRTKRKWSFVIDKTVKVKVKDIIWILNDHNLLSLNAIKKIIL